MKNIICPFWLGTKAIPKLKRAGVEWVLEPYLDETIGWKPRFLGDPDDPYTLAMAGWAHKVEPVASMQLIGSAAASPNVFWGDPKAAARQIPIIHKHGMKAGLWVSHLNWWRMLPPDARWTDQRGTEYQVTPCPASAWYIKRLARYFAVAKKLGASAIVMDCENYASGRYTQFGGKKPNGGIFGSKSPPVCHCGRHAATVEGTWAKARAYYRRMYGEAFYGGWVHQWFGQRFDEGYTRTWSNQGPTTHAGVWVERAGHGFLARQHKAGFRPWVWSDRDWRGGGPDAAYVAAMREAWT